MSTTDNSITQIIDYCLTLTPQEQLKGGCACSLAVQHDLEKLQDYNDALDQHTEQVNDFYAEVGQWDRHLRNEMADTGLSGIASPVKSRCIEDADGKPNNNTDKNAYQKLKDNCIKFKNSSDSDAIMRDKCNVTGSLKYEGVLDDLGTACSYCDYEVGKFWKFTVDCQVDISVAANTVRSKYIQKSLNILLSEVCMLDNPHGCDGATEQPRFPKHGDWPVRFHPAVRENVLKYNGQVHDMAYPLLRIEIESWPDITNEGILVPMKYKVHDFPKWDARDISCCSNLIECEGTCNGSQFENILQNCVIDVEKNESTTNGNSSINDVNFASKDSFVFDTTDEDQVRALIIVIVVSVIILVICGAVVVRYSM
jgi:hypothetical protein